MPRKKEMEDKTVEVLVEAVEEVSNEHGEKPMENSEDKKILDLGILRLSVKGDEEEATDEEEIIWHELSVAYRTRKIVTATITGIEHTKNMDDVVVAYYKSQRIAVPLAEMMIDLPNERQFIEGSNSERLKRIASIMLGAEIDLIVKGMDKKSMSIVGSRREAMIRKRERYYLTPLTDGLPHIRVGRVIEARIISVTPQVARFEVFGIEVSLPASQLSWDWVSDVSQEFSVGETMNLLVENIEGDNIDNLKIKVNAKSLIVNTSAENLRKCAVQGRYIGEITSMRNGVAYIRLKIGVNAIAHTNNDRRMPGKGDIVSFVVTRINEDYGNVSGIITRIIKQKI